MALSPDMLKEYFEQAQKCKISWKIEKVQKNGEDQCSTNLTLFIKWENNKTHFMNISLLDKACSFDSYYKPFFEDDIKIWNQVEYILDKSNYYSFDYNTNTINTDNIPFCSENKIEIPQNNYNFEIFSWIIFFSIIIWVLMFKIYKKN